MSSPRGLEQFGMGTERRWDPRCQVLATGEGRRRCPQGGKERPMVPARHVPAALPHPKKKNHKNPSGNIGINEFNRANSRRALPPRWCRPRSAHRAAGLVGGRACPTCAGPRVQEGGNNSAPPQPGVDLVQVREYPKRRHPPRPFYPHPSAGNPSPGGDNIFTPFPIHPWLIYFGEGVIPEDLGGRAGEGP